MSDFDGEKSEAQGQFGRPAEYSIHSQPLGPKQQFWWGFFGGCMVLLFRVWTFANASAPDIPYPNPCFRTILLCALWLAFPFVSGLVSRLFEPHSRLHAVIEGAAAPALILAIAKDFPL
jgi:hypothetical protein